jgi:hypothetical protein
MLHLLTLGQSLGSASRRLNREQWDESWDAALLKFHKAYTAPLVYGEGVLVRLFHAMHGHQ